MKLCDFLKEQVLVLKNKAQQTIKI